MSHNILINRLKEREKELFTLYRLDEVLNDSLPDYDDAFGKIVELIPKGWQYSTNCEVCIEINNHQWKSKDYKETSWMQQADIIVNKQKVGEVKVAYLYLINKQSDSQFLPDEARLLNSIAQRIGNAIAGIQQNNLLRDASAEKDFDKHWKWRYEMAHKFVDSVNLAEMHLNSVYIAGSAWRKTSTPKCDLDLIICCSNEIPADKMNILNAFIEGWSHGLTQCNYFMTGQRVEQFIDVHYISESDLGNEVKGELLNRRN